MNGSVSHRLVTHVPRPCVCVCVSLRSSEKRRKAGSAARAHYEIGDITRGSCIHLDLMGHTRPEVVLKRGVKYHRYAPLRVNISLGKAPCRDIYYKPHCFMRRWTLPDSRWYSCSGAAHLSAATAELRHALRNRIEWPLAATLCALAFSFFYPTPDFPIVDQRRINQLLAKQALARDAWPKKPLSLFLFIYIGGKPLSCNLTSRWCNYVLPV